jgi:NAD(P)-dependent dehydrogenase (short-subunit alcohol dehydrogenase family)
VARALQSAGARVAVLDKSAAPPDTGSIADLKIGAVDLTDTADAGRAMRTVVETFGRLDILVNVAWGFVWQRVDDGSPAGGVGAYAGSKAGIQCFTVALSRELAAYSISVNAVLPSIIDTPQNRAAMPDADFACWVSPQEIAKLIAFLASDAADQITGAAIEITRGT